MIGSEASQDVPKPNPPQPGHTNHHQLALSCAAVPTTAGTIATSEIRVYEWRTYYYLHNVLIIIVCERSVSAKRCRACAADDGGARGRPDECDGRVCRASDAKTGPGRTEEGRGRSHQVAVKKKTPTVGGTEKKKKSSSSASPKSNGTRCAPFPLGPSQTLPYPIQSIPSGTPAASPLSSLHEQRLGNRLLADYY